MSVFEFDGVIFAEEGSHWAGELPGEERHMMASQARRSSSFLILTGLRESMEKAEAKEGIRAAVRNREDKVFIFFSR